MANPCQEMLTETQRLHLTSVRTAIVKKQPTTNANKDAGKDDSLYTTGSLCQEVLVAV